MLCSWRRCGEKGAFLGGKSLYFSVLSMNNRFFLTTAIDYANGRPHFGHAYEKCLADFIARYERSVGKEVFFLTGTDEHGQKVQQSAQKADQSPQSYVDEVTGHFVDLCGKLQISYSKFVRTTNPDHKKFVQQALQRLFDQGEIYFQEHEGFYSVRQEQFVTEKDQVEGVWPEIFGEVVRMKEPNYFFRISKYQEWLKEELHRNPDWIYPAFRRNEILGALEKPLDDLCISRPKSRLTWGIELPFNSEFVTYVWFDALINYVSFADFNTPENRWPADLHIIGKDILVPAHGVYWPIMLKALGWELPKKFIVHGWWLNRGAKMSKSTGNSVDPTVYLEKFGSDAFRYFVNREMTLGQDSDFTDEKFIQRYKSDLGNDLGNLVNRSLAMLHRYRQGIVPDYADSDLQELDAPLRSNQVMEDYQKSMSEYHIHMALQNVWTLVQSANQYVEQNAPWKLAKDPAQATRLDLVLAHLVETCRRLSVLVDAIMPHTALRIRKMLQISEQAPLLKEAIFGKSMTGKQTAAAEVLFPRIEEEV